MKKIYFYTLLLGLLAFTACEDEKSPVMELQKASAFEPFSQSDFTFNDENAAAEFPEIKWTPADYGVKAVVNYDVTLTNDANAKTVLLGETGYRPEVYQCTDERYDGQSGRLSGTDL